jgi:hypothetical protein
MRCPIHKDIVILEDVNDLGYFCFECQKYYTEKELKELEIFEV